MNRAALTQINDHYVSNNSLQSNTPVCKSGDKTAVAVIAPSKDKSVKVTARLRGSRKWWDFAKDTSSHGGLTLKCQVS